MQDVQDVEAVQLDSPTTDGTAGIGAEFESPAFYFSNPQCSSEDTNAAKKQIVAQRIGTYWELTANSNDNIGSVNAEYILDGSQIKVGSGDAAKAGKAWADDLVALKPWAGGTPPNTVNIANSNCNSWKIATNVNQDPSKLPWSPQITAPLPLVALTVFMPRTEFITLCGIVKSKLTGDLFMLFDNPACYKTSGGEILIDTDWCSGSLTSPNSNCKFRTLTYANLATNAPTIVNIKDWIIGGQGTRMEKLYKLQRSALLFEFRDLDPTLQTSGVENFLDNVDKAIQDLHAEFANAPTKKKRDSSNSCVRPFAAAAATSTVAASAPNAAPIVVDPKDPPSQPSCVPSPRGPVKDSHEDELQKAAAYSCSKYADSTVQNGPINIADTIIAGDRTDGREPINIVYVYTSSMGN